MRCVGSWVLSKPSIRGHNPGRFARGLVNLPNHRGQEALELRWLQLRLCRLKVNSDAGSQFHWYTPRRGCSDIEEYNRLSTTLYTFDIWTSRPLLFRLREYVFKRMDSQPYLHPTHLLIWINVSSKLVSVCLHE